MTVVSLDPSREPEKEKNSGLTELGRRHPIIRVDFQLELSTWATWLTPVY